MKYLSDYTDEPQFKLFKECNAFFAFSMRQFNEQKKEGIKYINMGVGLICDERYVEKLINGLDEIQKNAIKQDIEDHGIERIILRELVNHEAYYTGDISSTFEAVEQYGVTYGQVIKLFKNRNAKLG